MLKKYKFFNLPKRCNLADNEEVISAIIKKYSKNKGLISVYNWGDPSVPGISDIDILFVFSGNVKKPMPFFSRNFNFLSSKARYLIRHPFMFIDENSFKNVKYIYPSAKFKLLYGRGININKISSEDNNCSNIALFNDIMLRHCPRDFIEQHISKRINVRDTLLRLNSLKYSTKILENLTKGKNLQWNQKLKLIKNLRKNWFKNMDFRLLASLNEYALNMSIDMINIFKIFLIKNNIVKINSGEKLAYNGIKNKSVFIKNWDKEKALEEMLKIAVNKKHFHSILPIELAAQLAEYSKADGRISRYIKDNAEGNISYQIKHGEVIKKRIGILNSQAELAFKLRHSDFAAFFDFGYRNKSGINNWVLNLADRWRF